MITDDISPLLSKTFLFSSLDENELGAVASFARARNVVAGETIFWEGDAPEWLYIVAEGKIKVAKYASSGKELIVAIFTQGNIFGELAVFDGKSYPASAVAQVTSRIIGIRRTDLLEFLSTNPSVTLKMINLLGTRLRDAHDRLRDMAGEKVDHRIASVLLMIADKIGPVIPFTRQEIADLSGITIETVIRVTTRLKEHSIISTTRGEITIIDKEKLKLFGDGKLKS